MDTLRLYWSSSIKNGRKNFGDWLSPVLCQHLSGREIEYAPLNRCDLVGIGSLLQRVKHRFWNRRTHIWGSGFITQQPLVNARHYYHAVRGKKTAALIRGAQIDALGDPGLLVNLLLPDHASVPKNCKVGIIPHYKDQSHAAVTAITKSLGDVKVLDIFSETHDFLRQVAGCEIVLSSSLHGLITADAFGIPNAWMQLSDEVRGTDFKFADYYSVFDIDPPPLTANQLTPDMMIRIAGEYRRDNLEQVRRELLATFPYPSTSFAS